MHRLNPSRIVRARRLRAMALGLAVLGVASAASAQSNTPSVFTLSTGGDFVNSYSVAPDGSLTLAGTAATGDAPQSLALSPDGQVLAVASGTQSNTVEDIFFYQVQSDGSLSFLSNQLVPDSPQGMEWADNNTLVINATQIGPTFVNSYNYDRTLRQLQPRDSFGAGTFAFSSTYANGVYFTETSFQSPANSIVSRLVDSNGQFSGGDEILIGSGSEFVVDLDITSDGRFFYGPGGISGSTSDLLFAFSADANGNMSAVQTLATGYRAPAEVAISADDSTLFMTNNGTSANSSSLVAFDIDPNTGELTYRTEFVLGDRGDANEIDTLPGFVFHLDGIGQDDTRGLEVIRINADGTLTGLGTTASQTGNTFNALVTWQPIPEPTFVAPLALLGLALRRRR